MRVRVLSLKKQLAITYPPRTWLRTSRRAIGRILKEFGEGTEEQQRRGREIFAALSHGEEALESECAEEHRPQAKKEP
jgi:hypothetical protein